MTIDLSIDSFELDSFASRQDFTRAISRWYGRDLTWDDLPELRSDTEQRIMEKILQGGRESELLIYKLVWLGTPLEDRLAIEGEIAHLIRTADEWQIRPAKGLKGSIKKFSNGLKHGWDKTYEVAGKTCDAVADFWKDHKKEIIIGAIVVATVVAVTAIIVCSGGSGTGAAVAGGATLIQSVSDESSDSKVPVLSAPPTHLPKPGQEASLNENFSPPGVFGQGLSEEQSYTRFQYSYPDVLPLPPTASPSENPMSEPLAFKSWNPQSALENVYGKEYVADLYRQFGFSDSIKAPPNDSPAISASQGFVPSFSDPVPQENFLSPPNQLQSHGNSSAGEKVRDLSSALAHKTLSGISELTSCVPQLLEEIKDIGNRFLPESLLDSKGLPEITPRENFEYLVAAGHEKIDQLFSTDQAGYYTPEAMEARDKFTIGIIPFPGIFSRGTFNANKLAEAGKAMDRAGFTRAGRGLMKHGYRDGSVFPKPIGNPDQVNEHGQRVLESILNHPEKKLIPGEFGRFGKVVDIYAPDIGGVRYSAEGEFIGFLEP